MKVESSFLFSFETTMRYYIKGSSYAIEDDGSYYLSSLEDICSIRTRIMENLPKILAFKARHNFHYMYVMFENDSGIVEISEALTSFLREQIKSYQDLV